MTLPSYLTGDTASTVAPAALFAVTLLALLIALVAVVAAAVVGSRLSKANKLLAATNRNLLTLGADLDARNERLGEANARLRQGYGLPPRGPMPRPGPPAEATVAFQAPTQQMPQVGPRIDRSAT
jgi:hypothetical protein